MTPVFIFSLPRSGSTLLQRILAAHDRVDSCAEPWVLLPVLYGQRSGTFAEYGHNIAVRGIHDALQEGSSTALYEKAVREFAMTLYREIASTGATHFVDKTPRYHLVVDAILQAFPDGRFIFLWRNPLSIAASIMRTWRNERWNLDRFQIDFFEGLPNLIAASQRTSRRVFCTRYEALIDTPEAVAHDVFQYLDLPFTDDVVRGFSSVGFKGELGDPTGPQQYDRISSETTDKWISTLSNPLRKRWMRKYLRWLGHDRLAHMGYELDELIAALNAAPTNGRFLLSDVLYRMRGALRPWIQPKLQRNNWKRLRQQDRLYPYY